MLSIQLNNIIFFGYHGVYEEEKLLGNEFEMNLVVQYHPSKAINELSETVDYVSLYEIVKQRMLIPTDLLETIVIDICNQIINQFTVVEKVTCSIKKLKPPIPDFNGSVGVNFELIRNK